MKRLCLTIFVFWLILSCISNVQVVIHDDFDDGVIDPSLWVTYGRKGGLGGLGAGNWQYSFSEIKDDDGYLEVRVWDPASANTYWGEGSVRTSYNFNDGNAWLINFKWENTVGFSPAFDCFGIQITDGGFPQNDNAYWIWNENPLGTVTLWYTVHWGSSPLPPGWQELIPPLTKVSWSVRIDPVQNVALFYLAPNGQGNHLTEVQLDPSHEWYLRFVQVDASAAGLPPRDNTFILYDFSAICLPRILKPNGGESLVAGNTYSITWQRENNIYSNDFEDPCDMLTRWSSNTKNDSTPSGRRFLGQFQNDKATLTLNNLPTHMEITLSFDLYVIRSWDGLSQSPDIWNLSVEDGPTLLRMTFGNVHWADPFTQVTTLRQAYPGSYPGGNYPIRTGAAEVDTLGYKMKPDYIVNADSVYNLTFTFAHSASTLQLNFCAENLQDYDPPDKSWGIDNVRVNIVDVNDALIEYSANNGQDWDNINTVPNIGSYE